MARIFLDTSVLSHKSLKELAGKLSEPVSQGDEFLISVLTYFEVLWGYRRANLGSSRYEELLEKLGIDVMPLLKEDAVLAAGKTPGKDKVVDVLIAATTTRFDASVCTGDNDFTQFLPEDKITIL